MPIIKIAFKITVITVFGFLTAIGIWTSSKNIITAIGSVSTLSTIWTDSYVTQKLSIGGIQLIFTAFVAYPLYAAAKSLKKQIEQKDQLDKDDETDKPNV